MNLPDTVIALDLHIEIDKTPVVTVKRYVENNIGDTITERFELRKIKNE